MQICFLSKSNLELQCPTNCFNSSFDYLKLIIALYQAQSMETRFHVYQAQSIARVVFINSLVLLIKPGLLFWQDNISFSSQAPKAIGNLEQIIRYAAIKLSYILFSSLNISLPHHSSSRRHRIIIASPLKLALELCLQAIGCHFQLKLLLENIN